MSDGAGGAGPALVVLAAGRAKRYGGCKPLAPVGPHGEAVIDLVASDALAAGFGTIVLVLGPSTGPPSATTWSTPGRPPSTSASPPSRAPLGTVNAVLCASEHVGDAPYGVGNADDIYGRDGMRPAGRAPRVPTATPTHWWATAWPTPSSASRRSPGASAASGPTGRSSASTSGAR